MNFNILFSIILIIQTFFLAELISTRPRSKSLNRVPRERSLLINADGGQNLKSESELDSESVPPPPSGFLELDKFPATRAPVKLHSDLNLECEAVGSPLPTIHWLKNGIPLEPQQASNYPENPSFSMSKVKSTLQLQCILPGNEAEYTCVAHNDHKKIIASTNVVIEENDSSEEIRPKCEYKLPMFFPNSGTSAYISSGETQHMENIGSNIILPCRAEGQPKPKIFWFDNHAQQIVSSQRFEIFPSGDLLIRDLMWTDMGEFSCLVENSFGSDIVWTFVYPLQIIQRFGKIFWSGNLIGDPQ